MNNKHQEKGAPTGPLIFTLPASSSVVILRPDWLDGTGRAAAFAKTRDRERDRLQSAQWLLEEPSRAQLGGLIFR
jgi:hypothetical protein